MSYFKRETLQKEYDRRYKKTIELINAGYTDLEDDYKCQCGNINVFGGEGYVDPDTNIFWCGYCSE